MFSDINLINNRYHGQDDPIFPSIVSLLYILKERWEWEGEAAGTVIGIVTGSK